MDRVKISIHKRKIRLPCVSLKTNQSGLRTHKIFRILRVVQIIQMAAKCERHVSASAITCVV